MFAAFVADCRAAGFRIFPECCGFDLVMVAPAVLPGPEGTWGGLRPGDVVAIEGKLRASVDVLAQAMPVRRRRGYWKEAPAPNWHVVLVPEASHAFLDVAWAVGCCVCVYPMPDPEEDAPWKRTRDPELRERAKYARIGHYPPSLRIDPVVPLSVPEVEVDVMPGLPAPRSVTPWKIAAVKLCLLGADGRDLTAAEVGKLARNFTTNRWLRKVAGSGKTAVYRLLHASNRPDVAYPEIATALRIAGWPK